MDLGGVLAQIPPMQQRSKRTRSGADRPKPLYRKVNTRARGVRHNSGPDSAWERGTKATLRAIADGVTQGKMVQGKERGLDYTPLYRFLLKNVGRPFDDVMAEALPRLPEEAPLWQIVHPIRDGAPYIRRTGESSYWSGLFVDEDGVLQIVAPDLRERDLVGRCQCCTHTFNGVPLSRPFPGYHEAQGIWRDLDRRFS